MITKNDELRTLVTLLTANVNKMCNTNDIEAVSNEFVEAKDRLITIFKLNVERLQK